MSQESQDSEVTYSLKRSGRKSFLLCAVLGLASVYALWSGLYTDIYVFQRVRDIFGGGLGCVLTLIGVFSILRMRIANVPELVVNSRGMHYVDLNSKVFEARWDSLSPFTFVRPGYPDIQTTVTGPQISDTLKLGQVIWIPVQLFGMDAYDLLEELNCRRDGYIARRQFRFQNHMKQD